MVKAGLMAAAFGMVGAVAVAMLPQPVQAGPLMRRVEQRRACQEFASKLQAASANPTMAQQVYQQGVLQLVATFGENPCTDIPAPAAPTPATPAPAPAPATAPTTAPTSSGPPSKQPSAQQQQACQQFASKLQSAAASGGSAAAQQTYAMGTQKLTGMFGPDPCPAVKPPQ
jgi:hypothetical protein